MTSFHVRCNIGTPHIVIWFITNISTYCRKQEADILKFSMFVMHD